MEKRLILGLCEGRHEIIANDGNIVSEFIFNQEVNPLDVEGLEKQAFNKIEALADKAGAKWEEGYVSIPNQTDYSDIYRYRYSCEAVIYITGLTVAAMAAVKAALVLCKSVVLMHYDRESGTYYEQRM